jgi:hypothetical protein
MYSLTVSNKIELKMSKNKVLRKIFVLNKAEASEKFSILQKKKTSRILCYLES